MSTWFSIAVTIFDVIWLTAVFVLLWRIWRNSVTHTNNMEKTLIDVAMRDSESVRKVAEAVLATVDMLKKDRT